MRFKDGVPVRSTSESLAIPSSEVTLSVTSSRVSVLSGHAERILSELKEAGDWGLTCDDIVVLTGIIHQSVSSCLKKLKDSGLVFTTDEERETKRGRPAKVNFARA